MIDIQKNNEYISVIQSKLTDERFIHSLNVAKCSLTLAKKYGANEQKAYLAGILHDIMKNATYEEMLNEIKKANFTLTDVERNNHKLWHAIAGAAFIKNELNIKDEEIISAIYCHTTAKKNMTLLDKIIYVADFISEDRTYNGIEEIRLAANENLEKAMIIGLQFTIYDLAKKQQLIHPSSIEAYNQLIINNKKEVSQQ